MLCRRGTYGIGYSLEVTTTNIITEVTTTSLVAIEAVATKIVAIGLATKSAQRRIRIASKVPKIKRILAGQDVA